MSTETVMSWEMDAMRFGAESSPLTVRDVVERHGGEMWFERERVRHQAFFRFLLPLASVQERGGSRFGQILRTTAAPSTTTSTCSSRPTRAARWTTACCPSWPTPCSTPKPRA
jgi:hypothetical protein